MTEAGWKRICFFFNDTATTEIYTLSLHDALPISGSRPQGVHGPDGVRAGRVRTHPGPDPRARVRGGRGGDLGGRRLDRKSTRLNSSHANISYAVFCLKKKTYSDTCLITSSHENYA